MRLINGDWSNVSPSLQSLNETKQRERVHDGLLINVSLQISRRKHQSYQWGGDGGCDCGGLLDGDGCGLGADGSHGGMVGCLVGSFLCL